MGDNEGHVSGIQQPCHLYQSLVILHNWCVIIPKINDNALLKDTILLIIPEVEVGLNICDPEKPARIRRWINNVSNEKGIDTLHSCPH